MIMTSRHCLCESVEEAAEIAADRLESEAWRRGVDEVRATGFGGPTGL